MMITGTRWLLSDGNSAPTQDFNIPPAVLLLPSPFNNTVAGTYICSSNNMQNDSSRDAITLSTGSEYVRSYVCIYMYVYICDRICKKQLYTCTCSQFQLQEIYN